MKKPLTSAKGRQWQAYNRWRANHRAIDQQRRLERIAEREAANAPLAAKPATPKLGRSKAWARVRIHFADGTSAGFSIRLGPFGLMPSGTRAGHALRRLLNAKGRTDSAS